MVASQHPQHSRSETTVPHARSLRLASRRPCVASILLLACMLGPLAACSRSLLPGSSGRVQVVSVDDFSPAGNTSVATPPPASQPARSQPASEEAPLVTVRPGAPVLTPAAVTISGDETLVESKVGDINGKPIYATEFLEPMADRLAAEARRLPPAQWSTWARRQIKDRLDGIITDELLRAEALARLTPEQKQGLRFFLAAQRENLASGASGSRTLAQQRLAEQEGLSEEEYIRNREQETLVRSTLMRDINNRVNVSWRDIEQRYQRDWDTFNPPPTAVFRLIRIPTAQTADVQAVNDALASGTPFEEVATTSGSTYKPDAGGVDEIPLTGPFEEEQFFGSDELNAIARTLTPGTHAGPFELGSSTAWLRLEEIRQQSMSLYDAQLLIQSQLRDERSARELDRFMSRLQQRASFTSLDDMREQLFQVALQRYGPDAVATPSP